MDEKPRIDAQHLWKWARKWSEKHYGDMPTFRQATRRFCCTLDEVEDAVEDGKGMSLGMDHIVGIRVGNAIGEYETRGEHQIETWKEEGS